MSASWRVLGRSVFTGSSFFKLRWYSTAVVISTLRQQVAETAPWPHQFAPHGTDSGSPGGGIIAAHRLRLRCCESGLISLIRSFT